MVPSILVILIFIYYYLIFLFQSYHGTLHAGTMGENDGQHICDHINHGHFCHMLLCLDIPVLIITWLDFVFPIVGFIYDCFKNKLQRSVIKIVKIFQDAFGEAARETNPNHLKCSKKCAYAAQDCCVGYDPMLDWLDASSLVKHGLRNPSTSYQFGFILRIRRKDLPEWKCTQHESGGNEFQSLELFTPQQFNCL